MEGREPFTIPRFEQPRDVDLIRFINWFQHQLARFKMQPIDFQWYARYVYKYEQGLTPYDVFWRDMWMLLRHPDYEELRGWWLTHNEEVKGRCRMVDHASFLAPLSLFLELVRRRAHELYGQQDWKLHVDRARQQRQQR